MKIEDLKRNDLIRLKSRRQPLYIFIEWFGDDRAWCFDELYNRVLVNKDDIDYESK